MPCALHESTRKQPPLLPLLGSRTVVEAYILGYESGRKEGGQKLVLDFPVKECEEQHGTNQCGDCTGTAALIVSYASHRGPNGWSALWIVAKAARACTFADRESTS